jgi:methyl-accepting chemotaxis protein
MFSTIKAKILSSIIVAILLGSMGIIYLVTTDFKNLGDSVSNKSLNMLSTSVFQTIRMGMNTGDPATIKQLLSDAKKIDGVANLAIYKSQITIDGFGLSEKFNPPKDTLDIFRNKKDKIIEDYGQNHTVRLLKPLVAEQVCLSCHYNAKAGDILGVMDLTFNLDELDSEILSYVTTIGIILSILAVLSIVFLVILLQNILFKRLTIFDKAIENLSKDGDTSNRIKCDSNDEIDTIAKKFNLYLDKVEDSLKQDRVVLDEVADVVQKAMNGFYTYEVKSSSNTPAIEELKTNFNKMISSTEESINDIMLALIEFANANYTYEVKNKGTAGNIGSLISSMDALRVNISEIVSMIAISSENLVKYVETLEKSAETLSTSATNQVESLDNTTASVNTITENIVDTSKKTKRMAQISEDVMEASLNGNRLANDTILAMNDINESTSTIHESINVIDQIAFQTNILSLNAAVEAATAGEAGKGFAVVAGEVRNLASRSAEAAKEIKDLVEKAQNISINGKEITENMKKGFDDLSVKIKTTTELIQEVASSSNRQLESAKEINENVENLENMVKNNNVVAHQVNELTHEISSMSNNLEKAINRIKYVEDTRHQVCDVDMVFDSSKLKTAHILFKQNNYRRLGDKTKWTVVNEKECGLGKWIVSNQNSECSRTKAWTNMNVYHKNIHSKVQDYVNLNAEHSSNQELFAIAQDIESNTLNIFREIDLIKKERCAVISNKSCKLE